MTLHAFQLLSLPEQLFFVVNYGTYLAQRWQDGCGMNLFHYPDGGHGFLVEVLGDDGQGNAMELRCFVEAGPLEEYAYGVRLPGERKRPDLTGRGVLF